MHAYPNRRQFLHRLAATGAAASYAACARAAAPSEASATQAELLRRAERCLAQRRLVVDYYRIGRKLAYPLPVTSLSIPDVVVPGIGNYPWATWLTWTLEERMLALGWAAQWSHDERARRAATVDLTALAAWPEYRQYPAPDLSSAHTARMLWTAVTRWTWVDGPLRDRLRAACRRHVESVLPMADRVYAAVQTKNDLLIHRAAHHLLHNIALIGTVGAALTAHAAAHPASARLNARLLMLFGALLDLRAGGFSEAVAYDGYVLDFVADWLTTLSDAQRRPVLDHPRLADYLDESTMLGAPGAAADVAELGDVEPGEMPFHLSAQAKLHALRPTATRAWLLERCPLERLRTDALAALRAAPTVPSPAPPRAGALDAHYAAVLRSGWAADDLAVAVACSTSPMGHLHHDNGSLVLGTRGRWLITDPGYQQYAKGEEREFTTGPTAHNAPVINGAAQTQKQPRRIVLESLAPNLHRVAIDLTACYPAAAGVTAAVRHVWLWGKSLVVVADRLDLRRPAPATYHWHARRDCAWWVDAGRALVSVDRTQLWFTAPQAHFTGADVQRLPGSRGQLSLVVTLPVQPVIWWTFALADACPAQSVSPDGRQLHVADQRFTV